MQTPRRFVIEGFQLDLNHAAYLVEVTPVKNRQNEQNVKELPDWVFHSKHAIWLTSGSAELVDRAMAGERIKQKLLQRLSRKNMKQTSSDLLPGALELIVLHSA
ncbi:MAG TPA: hypothetical protein VLH08_04860 [Acidobacteriota bacterium]|nr:hypothetical protein [Acidobacteriota bacterium]